mmetsp:Transcript_10291/g.16917  ORF Transcript_10291/g.16917 Transcript_10291/m.16917 type:complete len:351 (-) Transcript_10291:321-1373(-)
MARVEEEGHEEAARRVLITGATGLLGRQVYKAFAEKNWSVRGLGNLRAKDPIVRCDLLEPEQLEAQFEDFKPTVVIHCAAERRPDRLEGNSEYAMKINAEVTKVLGGLCSRRNVWIISLSTNYVFDGKDAPYAEDAATNPLSTYGQSKLDGEKALMEVNPKAAILRVPLLFGPLEYLGESSVTTLLDSIGNEAPKFDHWQERFPTYSVDVAGLLEAFSALYLTRAEAAGEDFSGIFHWQGNQMQTKYTMATTIAGLAGAPVDRFICVDTAPAPGSAPRPQHERMLCTRCEKLLGIEGEPHKFRTDFTVALEECLRPFLAKLQESADRAAEEDQKHKEASWIGRASFAIDG